VSNVASLLAGVAACTVLLTMVLACAEHLAEPAALSRALTAHGVVRAPVAVAGVVIAAEGLLGVVGIAGLWQAGGRTLIGVLLGCFALLTLYAGYGLQIRSLGRSGPCGCSRLELPMTGWVVARAAILAGLALLASVRAAAIVPLPRPGLELAVVLAAAITFTLLLWHLPAAMHEPVGGTPR
jgi:hypothetical protein